MVRGGVWAEADAEFCFRFSGRGCVVFVGVSEPLVDMLDD